MMDALDLSGLTDDQLVGLARECCMEAARRNPAARAAMESMMLDEAERARIAKSAGEAEAAAIRARERGRIAQEAAAAVRAADAASHASERQRLADEAAAKAAEQQQRSQAATINWLAQAAPLVGHQPAEISILLIDSAYGRRVLINRGCDRYARDHLVDYNTGTAALKTPRELVKRKPAIAALCARFAALNPRGTFHLCGADYDWSAAA